MTRREWFAALLLTLIFGVTLWAYLLDPSLEVSAWLRNGTYLIPPAVAVVAALFTARAYGIPSAHARNFVLIAGGLMLWFVGEVLFTSYILAGVDPFPSLADVFYLLAYPLLAIGLWSESRSTHTTAPVRDRTIFYIAATLVAALVVYVGVIRAYDPEADIVANVVAMSYGLADLVLIFAVGRTMLLARTFRGGALSLRWLVLLGGVASILVGDLLFALFNVQYEENLQPYILLDAFFAGGYCALAYGFISLTSLLKRIRARASEPASRRLD